MCNSIIGLCVSLYLLPNYEIICQILAVFCWYIGTDVKIVAGENAEWLVTFGNHLSHQ